MRYRSSFGYRKGSLEPVAGIAIGFFLTWVIGYLVKPPPNSASDIALQLYSLQFIIFTWAASVAGTGKTLHGGGVRDATRAIKDRYHSYTIYLLPLQLMAGFFIAFGVLSAGLTLVISFISIMAYEILFGRPVFWLRHFHQVFLNISHLISD